MMLMVEIDRKFEMSFKLSKNYKKMAGNQLYTYA